MALATYDCDETQDRVLFCAVETYHPHYETVSISVYCHGAVLKSDKSQRQTFPQSRRDVFKVLFRTIALRSHWVIRVPTTVTYGNVRQRQKGLIFFYKFLTIVVGNHPSGQEEIVIRCLLLFLALAHADDGLRGYEHDPYPAPRACRKSDFHGVAIPVGRSDVVGDRAISPQ